MKFSLDDLKIGIVGLGYVGLPLAVEFGKKVNTLGFDINDARLSQLQESIDLTQECDSAELRAAKHLTFTSNIAELKSCNFYIVTVPTPVDEYKRPVLTPLINASKMLAKVITKNDIVVFESTVYPGATEEDCVPVIEKASGLIFNKDFFIGYSPERINPGDKQHRVVNIKKVIAGSTSEALNIIEAVYNLIVAVGTHKVSSIKVAEAAKVIENAQRDLNIAFVNELSVLFNQLGIDTEEVLKAAATKWNFLPFRPGLVGGHCISVDPYYLTHKAQSIGYHPEVILAGRRINDNMSAYVASQLVKAMLTKGIQVKDANVLLMGLTFKENCPDIRNTPIVDILHELQAYNINVDIYDPCCNVEEAKCKYDIDVLKNKPQSQYDALVIAVAHDQFKAMPITDIKALGKANSVIYDLKYVLPKAEADIRL